jgi:hypothetical protein
MIRNLGSTADGVHKARIRHHAEEVCQKCEAENHESSLLKSVVVRESECIVLKGVQWYFRHDRMLQPPKIA